MLSSKQGVVLHRDAPDNFFPAGERRNTVKLDFRTKNTVHGVPLNRASRRRKNTVQIGLDECFLFEVRYSGSSERRRAGDQRADIEMCSCKRPSASMMTSGGGL